MEMQPVAVGNCGGMPPRVETAMAFMHFARGVMDGTNGFSELSTGGRDLTKREAAAYDASLGVIISYLNGEMDYGDVPPRQHGDEGQGDEGQGERSHVPVDA